MNPDFMKRHAVPIIAFSSLMISCNGLFLRSIEAAIPCHQFTLPFKTPPPTPEMTRLEESPFLKPEVPPAFPTGTLGTIQLVILFGACTCILRCQPLTVVDGALAAVVMHVVDGIEVLRIAACVHARRRGRSPVVVLRIDFRVNRSIRVVVEVDAVIIEVVVVDDTLRRLAPSLLETGILVEQEEQRRNDGFHVTITLM